MRYTDEATYNIYLQKAISVINDTLQYLMNCKIKGKVKDIIDVWGVIVKLPNIAHPHITFLARTANSSMHAQ